MVFLTIDREKHHYNRLAAVVRRPTSVVCRTLWQEVDEQQLFVKEIGDVCLTGRIHHDPQDWREHDLVLEDRVAINRGAECFQV